MDAQRTTTGPALLGRLVWIMVGPITLFLLAISIVDRRGGWLSLTSLAYFPVLGGTVLGRWLEFRVGHPMTATGEPATTEHLRRYALAATALALAGWVVAHLLAAIR
jgi:hypothetical protein